MLDICIVCSRNPQWRIRGLSVVRETAINDDDCFRFTDCTTLIYSDVQIANKRASDCIATVSIVFRPITLRYVTYAQCHITCRQTLHANYVS
jgi:hypothetical protein